MRNVPVLAAAALVPVVLVSGCGRHHGTPAGPPLPVSATAAPLPAPLPSGPVAAICGSATQARELVTITYADNGQTLCVRRGAAVQVYLQGTPANRWMAIRARGDALAPHANGRLMLRLGMTGASFLAAHPGTATLTSFQRPCGPGATPGNGAAQSGTLECGVIIAFRVTVKVT